MKQKNSYDGERMARIETTLEFVKNDVKETKESVANICNKFDAFILAQAAREQERVKEFDARYALKWSEKYTTGLIIIISCAFVGAIIYLIAKHPQALLG
jgi:hypothetical protein